MSSEEELASYEEMKRKHPKQANLHEVVRKKMLRLERLKAWMRLRVTEETMEQAYNKIQNSLELSKFVGKSHREIIEKIQYLQTHKDIFKEIQTEKFRALKGFGCQGEIDVFVLNETQLDILAMNIWDRCVKSEQSFQFKLMKIASRRLIDTFCSYVEV